MKKECNRLLSVCFHLKLNFDIHIYDFVKKQDRTKCIISDETFHGCFVLLNFSSSI